MTPLLRTIIGEIGLSAVIAAASVIGLPKLVDPAAAANYPLAIAIFVLCSLSFAGYEFFTRQT